MINRFLVFCFAGGCFYNAFMIGYLLLHYRNMSTDRYAILVMIAFVLLAAGFRFVAMAINWDNIRFQKKMIQETGNSTIFIEK
jgi:bacteriorhodopsin